MCYSGYDKVYRRILMDNENRKLRRKFNFYEFGLIATTSIDERLFQTNRRAVNNHEWQPKEESVYVQEDPVFREFVRRVKMNENPSPPSGKEGYEQAMDRYIASKIQEKERNKRVRFVQAPKPNDKRLTLDDGNAARGMLTVRTVQGTGQKEDAHRLRSATTNLCIIKKERMEISQYYTLSKKSLIIDLSAAFFELTGTSVEFTYLFIDDKSGHCLLLSHPQKEVVLKWLHLMNDAAQLSNDEKLVGDSKNRIIVKTGSGTSPKLTLKIVRSNGRIQKATIESIDNDNRTIDVCWEEDEARCEERLNFNNVYVDNPWLYNLIDNAPLDLKDLEFSTV